MNTPRISCGSLLALGACILVAQPLFLAAQTAIPASPIPATDVIFSASGSGAVLRTAQGKLGDIVNVLDYGAICDGNPAHDDGPAFNAAIAALAHGGSVFVPATPQGCLVNSSITLKSGIQLIGASKGANLIVTDPSVSPIITEITKDGTEAIVIQNISIVYRGKDPSNGDGVQLTDSFNDMFKTVNITGLIRQKNLWVSSGSGSLPSE